MKSILSLALFLISIVSTGQVNTDFKDIDSDYQHFNRNTSFPDNKNKISKIHSSHLPSLNFQTENNSTFGIQILNDQKEAKLNAAIIFALSNQANYEFVADLFDKTASEKSFVLKEMLRISINSIPDTSSFKINYKEKLNQIESLVQYDFKKTSNLRSSIQIIYFSSIQETQNGIEKVKKIQITHNNVILYESNNKNHLLEICNNQNNLNLSNHIFSYKNDDYELQLRGGLWNHLLTKKLEEISHQVFEKSAFIKQVNDLHSTLNNDLKRSISTGSTKQHQIKINNLFSPKFENVTILEFDNNHEQIIERYNKFYKKSELNLSNNIRNGFNKTWSKSGNLTKNAFYKNGLLEGNYIEFFSDLSPKIVTYYHQGEISKSFIEYFKNGNISKNLKYKNGKKHGTQKTYHENGKIKRKGRYKKSQPKGWHSFYDSSGNRIKKCKFKNGTITKTRDYN